MPARMTRNVFGAHAQTDKAPVLVAALGASELVAAELLQLRIAYEGSNCV